MTVSHEHIHTMFWRAFGQRSCMERVVWFAQRGVGPVGTASSREVESALDRHRRRHFNFRSAVHRDAFVERARTKSQARRGPAYSRRIARRLSGRGDTFPGRCYILSGLLGPPKKSTKLLYD